MEVFLSNLVTPRTRFTSSRRCEVFHEMCTIDNIDQTRIIRLPTYPSGFATVYESDMLRGGISIVMFRTCSLLPCLPYLKLLRSPYFGKCSTLFTHSDFFGSGLLGILCSGIFQPKILLYNPTVRNLRWCIFCQTAER